MIEPYYAPLDLATRAESFEFAVLNALIFFKQAMNPKPPEGFKMEPKELHNQFLLSSRYPVPPEEYVKNCLHKESLVILEVQGSLKPVQWMMWEQKPGEPPPPAREPTRGDHRCILLTDYKKGYFEVVGAQHYDPEATLEWLTWNEILSRQTEEQQKSGLVISWDDLC